MKLIALNTWGGRASEEKILDFISENSDTDIFCLQEVWWGGEHMAGKTAGGLALNNVVHQLLHKMQDQLPHHVERRANLYKGFYGLVMFVRNDFKIIHSGDVPIYREPGYVSATDRGDHGRSLQYVTLETPHGTRTIVNIHGLWQPGVGKGDLPDRITQSEKILNFTTTLDHPFVLCGDLNLRPDTESIRMLERAGMHNLITEYGITSTRTNLYTKPERYADYVFTSSGIEVQDFRVLPDEVSDHAALELQFE